MTRQRISAATAIVAIVFLSGCGSSARPLARVTGAVTYNSEPVVGAVVTFVYGDGAVASGNTDAQGKFAIDAPYGEAKVAVSKASAAPVQNVESMTPTEAMARMHGNAKSPEDMAQAKEELPSKYKTPETSGLVAPVVEGGTNEFSFALTD